MSQTPTQIPASDDTPIRVNTVLINIPLIVSDKAGRYVGGLKREDFSVTLDGEKQEIDYFADADVPLNVAIIIDISGSTVPFADGIVRGAKAFLDQLRPEDRGLIVTSDTETDVVCPLTSDKKKLKKAIEGDYWSFQARQFMRAKNSVSRGRGSLVYDGIYQVVAKELAGVKGRKAVIVLTDGFIGGAVSQITFHSALVVGDTLVYPVMYLTPQHLKKGEKSIKWADLIGRRPGQQMYQIASETGGRLLVAGKDMSFKEAFQNVADELRKQYVLGFVPSNLGHGPGRIGLGVDRPDALLRSKKTIRVTTVAEQ